MLVEVKPPRIVDLFRIQKREGESLKDYLNLFCDVSMRIYPPNEEMFIDSFVKGLLATYLVSPFYKMVKTRRRAIMHIEIKVVMKCKSTKEKCLQTTYSDDLRNNGLTKEDG